MLQGFPTTSVDAARGLWALSRTVLASPTLKEQFESKEGTELLAALDESEEGRDFRRQLDEFLFDYGWRHDAVYDLADVPWREDPAIPLGNIRAMMDLPETEDPELQYQANVAAREELFAKLRERLADDPDTMAKLDELYEAARYSFPLTEDHAFYIDQMYISVFRRFVLAVGDRLVANGVFDQPDDVFFLYRDELVDVLENGGDRRALVAERRASFERAGTVSPPSPLGTPPPPPEVPDPFMDALVTRLLGMVPPGDENPDTNVLKAVAGSPGVYTGPARGLPLARPGHRRPRGGRDHGRRDDPPAVGAPLLARRGGRLRRRRRPLAQRDRRPGVRRPRRRRHQRRHDRDQDRPDDHRRRHQGRRLPRRPRGLAPRLAAGSAPIGADPAAETRWSTG